MRTFTLAAISFVAAAQLEDVLFNLESVMANYYDF
jgi:hypothetical protein